MMTPRARRLVRALLVEWLELRLGNASDHSSDFARDASAAIAEAKRRADDLGIEWDDDMIPGYIHRMGLVA